MKKILLTLIMAIITHLYADNSLRRVSLIEYIEIVSFITGEAYYISQDIQDKENIHFFIPKDIQNNRLFVYALQETLKDKDLIIDNSSGIYIIKKFEDEKYHLYKFQNVDPKDINSTLSIFENVNFSLLPSVNGVAYSATDKQDIKIKRFLKALDIPKKQEKLKITIFSTSLDDLKNVGMDSDGFKIDLTTFGKAVLNPDGLTTTFTQEQSALFKATLQFLTQNDVSTIEQSPTLIIRDNESSSLSFVDTIPYKTSITQVQDGISTTQEETEYRDIGLQLTITPRLFPAYTFIDLKLTNEEITNLGDKPTSRKMTYSQKFELKKGEVLILTGLTKTTQKEVNQKVPVLGDIPILEYIFSNDSTTKSHKIITLMIEHVGHVGRFADGGTREQNATLLPPLSIYQKTVPFKVQGVQNEK